MKYATRGETLHLVRFRSDAKPWAEHIDAHCAVLQHLAERRERGEAEDYRDYQIRHYLGDGFYVLYGDGASGWLTY